MEPPEGPQYLLGQQEFIRHYRHPPVSSCGQIAALHGVPLDHVLKSIVLNVDGIFIGAHIPGGHAVLRPAVEAATGAFFIRLASEEELGVHGLAACTVNPFNLGFCRGHLLSRHLAGLDEVSILDGSGAGSATINPRCLGRWLQPLRVGQLSCSKSIIPR